MTPLDPAIQAYREKVRHDHATLLYAAIQEGKDLGETIGEARGKYLGRAEIARNMKRRGRPIDQIVEDTGLSAGEIAKL
jgi:predicted transposase YdaD